MNPKFEGIWKLLNQYDFGIDNQYFSDLTCLICKKILIDGRQAPCACKYCYKCINCYLNNGKMFCPGSNEECKEEEIQIDINIVADYSTMRKISKLKVRCPLENCSYEDELSNIETHLRVCNAKPTSCPYVPIGCNELTVATDKLNDHLNVHSNNHAKLMIDTIENLKNQLKVNETEYQMKIENLTLQNEILKEENSKIQISVNQIQMLFNQYNKEFSEKLNQLTQNQNKLDIVNQEFKGNQREVFTEIRKINLKSKEFQENVENRINNINLSFSPIDEKLEKSIDEISKLKIVKLEKSIDEIQRKTGNIHWKIELNDEIDLENDNCALLCSDYFYSHPHGYKLQLVLKPGGCWDSSGFGVSVYIRMLEGTHDCRLQWPVTIDVTVGIINQDIDQHHKIDTRTIEFAKAPSDSNSTFKFRRSDLVDLVLQNNCLIIVGSIAIVSIG